MSFLVLLLAVWIEKFSALRHRVQRDNGWTHELNKLEASPRLSNRPWLVLAVLVLLPVALLALLLVVIEPVAYGLLALPIHLLVVTYSLGRGDLLGDLGPFRDAWRRDVGDRWFQVRAPDQMGLIIRLKHQFAAAMENIPVEPGTRHANACGIL